MHSERTSVAEREKMVAIIAVALLGAAGFNVVMILLGLCAPSSSDSKGDAQPFTRDIWGGVATFFGRLQHPSPVSHPKRKKRTPVTPPCPSARRGRSST